jgi:hypothetical protein
VGTYIHERIGKAGNRVPGIRISLFYGVVVLRLELIAENTLPIPGPMNSNIPIKQIGIKSRSNGDNTEATARPEVNL